MCNWLGSSQCYVRYNVSSTQVCTGKIMKYIKGQQLTIRIWSTFTMSNYIYLQLKKYMYNNIAWHGQIIV